MPTTTKARQNGHAAAPVSAPPRRWLLSQPIALPAFGTFGELQAIYDLDAVMRADWLYLQRDPRQQVRRLQAERNALWEAFHHAWDQPVDPSADPESDPPPLTRRAADEVGYEDALWTVREQERPIIERQTAAGREMSLRVLRVVIARVDGPDGPEIEDADDDAAWAAWPKWMLDWLATTGMTEAQNQLTGPLSRDAP